ncbi:MAG: hypothetical protein QOJ56_6021 [Mycobacterium sp.]|jgi:hypothetical protein|nr:hypothetical protein [Mycobacterium sp.]
MMNEDRLAIDVYRHAEKTGEAITLGFVERRLAELMSHEPNCPCGLCTVAARVRPPGVYQVASAWAASIANTRRRALR